MANNLTLIHIVFYDAEIKVLVRLKTSNLFTDCKIILFLLLILDCTLHLPCCTFFWTTNKVIMGVMQALFLPVSKKLKAQKTQKISASKKTQGPFWAKNSVCWSQFEISAKKLWNFDHLKPILTDFMVINENFEDFLINLAQN